MNQPTFTSAFELQNSPQDIKLIDTTDYISQGIAYAQVKGIFELKSVVGIFHAGDPTYVLPDIDRIATDNFIHAAPLDSNGVVINGLYSFKYTVQISQEVFVFNVTDVDQTGGKFKVSGNCLSNIINAIGGIFDIVGSMANSGTYALDIPNCSYDSVTNKTIIATTDLIPSPVVDGQVNFDVNTTYTTTNTVNYCFLEPAVKIEAIDDCFKSTLKVTDLTNYAATSCGVIIQSQSIVGSMVINYPMNPVTNTPMAAPITVSINNANVSYTVNPICTGVFQITLDVDVTYILPDGTVVVVHLDGYDDCEVECEEGLCCASQCIENVKTAYDAAKGQNLVEADKLRNLLIAILSEWMLYSIFYECDDINKANQHLANIIALVQASNCNCCPGNSNVPVWVATPTNSGTGTTTVVTTCGNGITVTASGVNPITYQVCLDLNIINSIVLGIVNGQKLFDHSDTFETGYALDKQVVMYNASTGKWNNVLLAMSDISDINMTGAATDYVLTFTAGGVAQFLPAVNHNVLYHRLVLAPPLVANTNVYNIPEDLMSYPIPINTLVNVGDCIEAEAWINTGSSSSKVLICFGTTPTPPVVLTMPYNTQYTTYRKYKIKITKYSNTQIAFEVDETSFPAMFGVPSSAATTLSWNFILPSLLTLSNSSVLTLKFQGVNTNAAHYPAANVVQAYLYVKINRI